MFKNWKPLGVKVDQTHRSLSESDPEELPWPLTLVIGGARRQLPVFADSITLDLLRPQATSSGTRKARTPPRGASSARGCPRPASPGASIALERRQWAISNLYFDARRSSVRTFCGDPAGIHVCRPEGALWATHSWRYRKRSKVYYGTVLAWRGRMLGRDL